MNNVYTKIGLGFLLFVVLLLIVLFVVAQIDILTSNSELFLGNLVLAVFLDAIIIGLVFLGIGHHKAMGDYYD